MLVAIVWWYLMWKGMPPLLDKCVATQQLGRPFFPTLHPPPSGVGKTTAYRSIPALYEVNGLTAPMCTFKREPPPPLLVSLRAVGNPPEAFRLQHTTRLLKTRSYIAMGMLFICAVCPFP